jgi:hypothetical protein
MPRNLARVHRSSLGISGTATKLNLIALARAVGFQRPPDELPLGDDVLAVYALGELALNSQLPDKPKYQGVDNARRWWRWLGTRAIAARILGVDSWVMTNPIGPTGTTDEERRVIALTGWLILGDWPATVSPAPTPEQLTERGDIPLPCARHWWLHARTVEFEQAWWRGLAMA